MKDKPHHREHYSVKGWCELHSISRRSFYRLVKSGNIKIVKLGRKTLVPWQPLPTSLPTSLSVIEGHGVAQAGTPSKQNYKGINHDRHVKAHPDTTP